MMLCVRCRANARRRLPTRPAIARHTGTVLTEVLLVRAAAGKVLLVRAVLLPGTVGTTSSFLELVVRSRHPIQYLHDAHDTYGRTGTNRYRMCSLAEKTCSSVIEEGIFGCGVKGIRQQGHL